MRYFESLEDVADALNGQVFVLQPDNVLQGPAGRGVTTVTDSDLDGTAEVLMTDGTVQLLPLPGRGIVHDQTTPLASWTIPHTFGRPADVSVYVAGELVEADVTSNAVQVTIVFPYPVAGVAVLS